MSVPVITYTITSTCGENGTISPVGAQTVTEHSDITFTITPNTNYFIQRLLIDDSAVTVSNTYTFTDVTANHTIYAEFALNCEVPSNLTAGNITHDSATLTWTAGGNETSWILEYKVADASTYTSVTTTSSSYTLTGLSDSTTYAAHVSALCDSVTHSACTEDILFTTTSEPVITYTITSTCGANGTITPSGIQTVAEHSDITFTITPNANYIIQQLLVDDSAVTVSGTYTFTDVTANHTIYAEFTPSGIEDYILSNVITFFPNPTTNYIHLIISDKSLQVNSIELLNIMGKQVNVDIVSTDNQTICVNVQGLASGIYFIRVTTNEGDVVKKIVKK